MQEQVSKESIQFAWKSTVLTAKILLKGIKAFLNHRKKKKLAKEIKKNTPKKGKQTVKQLIGQGQGVSSMEIGDSGIREFKRIANKFGVDFAITKDKTVDPPMYTVFFKGRDTDAFESILKEYAFKQTKRKKRIEKARTSILEKLKKFKEIVAKMSPKVKEKRKEQER